MLETLTLDTFSPLIGQTFQVHVQPDRSLPVELVEARAVGVQPAAGSALKRQPFSLTFRGAPQPILPQCIYSLAHPALGNYDLFIVPLGPRDGGMLYEAIIS